MVKRVYQMSEQEKKELLKRIDNDLKKTLTQKRYLHSISTMKKAQELAKKYSQDELIVMLTALTHDIAKEMTQQEYTKYAKDNHIRLDWFDKIQGMAVHGKIGANIARTKYGFTREMQEAILYHTTARANMTMLDKIIFLADKTEELREGESAEKLRKVLDEGDLDDAILYDIDYYTIPRIIETNKLIHPNCIYARNDILARKLES